MVAEPQANAARVLTYRYTPSHATRVTFFEGGRGTRRRAAACLAVRATYWLRTEHNPQLEPAGRCGSEAPRNTPQMSERIRLGVVMDPIENIKYPKDSTLGM